MFRNNRVLLFVVLVLTIFVVTASISMAEESKPVTSSTPASVPVIKTFPAVVEMEDFSITNGKIVEDSAASKGKAVVANDMTFVATKTVKFDQKGMYQLTMVENAPDGNMDAINVQINDLGAVRTFPGEYGKYVNCQKGVVFTLDAPGDVTIKVFTSNEKGAFYDKVVIAPFQ